MKVFHLTLLLTWCQLHCVLGSSVQCGRRFTEFSSSSSGIVGGREQDPGQLAAPTQAFPWLVKVHCYAIKFGLLDSGFSENLSR